MVTIGSKCRTGRARCYTRSANPMCGSIEDRAAEEAKGNSMTKEHRAHDAIGTARPRRRSVCNGIAAAVVAFGLCGTMEAVAQSAAPTKLDFAGSVTWLGQAPIMVALEKGFFKDEGLEVNFQTILNSSDRVAALTAGSVAFSNLG